jgi:hypothetical protein
VRELPAYPVLPCGRYARRNRHRGLIHSAGRNLSVAVDALVDGEWAEPDHLEQLGAVATRFELADGEARTVTLIRQDRGFLRH